MLKHGSILFIGHIVGDYLKTHVKQNLSWAGSDNILPTIQSAIYRLGKRLKSVILFKIFLLFMC